MKIIGNQGLEFPDGSIQSNAAYVAWRNKIMNGDMATDQRNNGAVVSPAQSVATYVVDRWWAFRNTTQGMNVQRVVSTAPGFQYGLRTTFPAAASFATTDAIDCLVQSIEGINVAEYEWGTVRAKPVTVGFWAKSNVTGLHSGVVRDAVGRCYPFTFTINTANTDEYKTAFVPGDTGGANWNKTTGIGMMLLFSLGTGAGQRRTAGVWSTDGLIGAAIGSVNIGETAGGYLEITGVQLEAGTKATPFERRFLADEEMRCKRYFQRLPSSFALFDGNVVNGNTYYVGATLPVPMRATPSASNVTSFGGAGQFGTVSGDALNNQSVRFAATATVTANAAAFYGGGDFSAEL